MPYDAGYDDDAPGTAGEEAGRRRRFSDFDCPDCSANNPADEAIADGDEVRCCYCGQEFKASVNDSGRLRLKVV